MPKRKNSEENYEILRKKLKKIEMELRRGRSRTRGRRIRLPSSSSTSPDDSITQRSKSNDLGAQRRQSDSNSDQHLSTVRVATSNPTLEYVVPTTAESRAAAVTETVEDVTPVLKDTAPELDSDLLEILGVDPTRAVKYGKDIQKDVALRFEHIAVNGLSKEDRKELSDKYLIPENCKLIGAPELNPEIKVALSETIIKRDKAIASKQMLMTSAISSLGEAITHILSSKIKQPDLLRILMDTGRALCDCQYNDTTARRNFITFAVKKDMKESLQDAKIDKFLFGQNLTETLKAAKAINKSGAELKPAAAPKPSTSKQHFASSSKNWKGSYAPRKQPARPTNPTSPMATRNQRANLPRQAQNQRPARTLTAPDHRR